MTRFLIVTAVMSLLVLVPGWSSAQGTGSLPQRFEFEQLHMGTLFRILLYAVDAEQASEAVQMAFLRIEELEGILSSYRQDSEMRRVSEKAYMSPQVLSMDLYSVLEKSLWFSRVSRGAFDVTIRPLAELWRQARESGELPDSNSLRHAADRVGYRNLLLNPRTRSLRFRRPGIELDLGGIGKGFAADEALEVLRRLGVSKALVSAGGDIRVGDSPPRSEGWRVEIELGVERRRVILLRDGAIATSGDLFQFVEIDGVRYSHIIDPVTSRALRGRRTATVIAPEAATADACATALSVLGPERGFQVLEELEGVSAEILLSLEGNDAIYRTDGFPP